jgi:hypothetical protein
MEEFMKLFHSPRWPLIATLALVWGCSAMDAPTGVQEANFALRSDERANHDSLQALKHAAQERFKAEKEARREEFQAARDAWRTFKKESDAAKKAGTWSLDLLRCEPQEYEGDAEVIGPNGGSLKVGAHELRIPKGALDQEVLITMERPVSELVEVELEPHGLEFNRAVNLDLSYSHCVQPQSFFPWIVYLSASQERILQVVWSTDKKGLKTITGNLEHFSRYAIAY